LVDVFDDWMRRLQRYIDISGEYVEYRLFFFIYGFPRITHSGDATVRIEHTVILYGKTERYNRLAIMRDFLLLWATFFKVLPIPSMKLHNLA
jgi:hypothetical protein